MGWEEWDWESELATTDDDGYGRTEDRRPEGQRPMEQATTDDDGYGLPTTGTDGRDGEKASERGDRGTRGNGRANMATRKSENSDR